MYMYCSNIFFCFQVQFYYFGASIIFDSVKLVDPQDTYSLDDFSSEFKKDILKDFKRINKVHLGVKKEKDFTEWEVDGIFTRLGSCQYKYVYSHTSHAKCSAVQYSQLRSLWKINPKNLLDLLPEDK